MGKPWGTLTGIRPAKVAAKLLKAGESAENVAKELASEYFVEQKRAELCVETARVALTMQESLTERDVALYVGIPFCPTRCAYCSFVSNSVEKSFDLIEPFVERLLVEIKEMADVAKKLSLNIISIYIGGGTPTALPIDALREIIIAVNESFDLSKLREYTLEAGRADTVDEQKIKMMTDLGISRICINPQTMNPHVLEAIGRAHKSEGVTNAVKIVKMTDAVMNLDIIAGLPGDSIEGFCSTLDEVLAFEPENLTVHTLSLKKGSRIMLEETPLPGDDCVKEMLDYASMRLREQGYVPYYLYRQKYISGGYENVGWCLPGHECIYNICMMEELTTVLAVGGGGVTKLVSQDNRIERVFNAKYPREYLLLEDKMERKFDEIFEFYDAMPKES